MAKRKVVGGYVAYSDDEDEDPEPPAPKKPYQPSILAAPAFKPPTSSRIQPSVARVQQVARPQPAVSSTARTPVKAATPSGARAVLPTPRETPARTSHLAPSSEPDIDERRFSTPVAQNRLKGKEREMVVEAGTSMQRSQPPARLTYERQINDLEGAVAEGATTIAEQQKEIEHLRRQVRDLTERLDELTKTFGEFCQAQATRWTQAEIAAHAAAPAVPAAPVAPVAPAAPAAPVGPSNAGTPEAVMTPGIGFNPRENTSSYVPVSEAGVLASIVAAFHHRPAANKPKICEFTALQRLVRASFFESLDNISQSSDIKPPFFDADGVHELFPAHLADPTTNFVNAYPDWDSDLGTQIAFLQRVLHRIRTATPKNASDYSVVGRTILDVSKIRFAHKRARLGSFGRVWARYPGGWLPALSPLLTARNRSCARLELGVEELLIEIIIDGPWNTCVSKWRKLSGDPEKIAAEYKRRRMYHRKAAKAGTRTEFRTEIPALADERYDSLFHSGMMSDEETDDEEEGGGDDNGEAEAGDHVKGEGESEGSRKGKGRRGRKKKYKPLGAAKQKPDTQKVFKVLRPDMRSSFANALYDAGSECIRQKRRALHGNSFQPLKRKTTVTVEVDGIPDVRCDGKIIKIPLFMFSSAWRRKHKTLIDRSTHLIDLDLKNPPDLDDFFHKYQRQENEEDEGPAPEPIPERPRPDTTDDQDDLGLDGGDEDARRLVDGEEGWVNDVEQNMGLGGEDEEMGELGEEDERDTNEELDPRALNPGSANTPQVAAPANLVAAQVPAAVIDPILRGDETDETEAAAPTTSRPRPKPKPQLPPVDDPPPAPTSSIQIQIPPLNNYIAPLPEPHADHGAHRSPSPDPPPPAKATEAEPEPAYEPQMPPGGLSHPPPPLISNPPPPVEPEQSPKRTRRAAATGAASSTQQGGAGENATVGGKKSAGNHIPSPPRKIWLDFRRLKATYNGTDCAHTRAIWEFNQKDTLNAYRLTPIDVPITCALARVANGTLAWQERVSYLVGPKYACIRPNSVAIPDKEVPKIVIQL